MANAGLPGTSGFVGEFLVIIASFHASFWYAFLAATTLVLGAAYTLWLVKRVVFGAVGNDHVAELHGPERARIPGARGAGGRACCSLGLWPAPIARRRCDPTLGEQLDAAMIQRSSSAMNPDVRHADSDLVARRAGDLPARRDLRRCCWSTCSCDDDQRWRRSCCRCWRWSGRRGSRCDTSVDVACVAFGGSYVVGSARRRAEDVRVRRRRGGVPVLARDTSQKRGLLKGEFFVLGAVRAARDHGAWCRRTACVTLYLGVELLALVAVCDGGVQSRLRASPPRRR